MASYRFCLFYGYSVFCVTFAILWKEEKEEEEGIAMRPDPLFFSLSLFLISLCFIMRICYIIYGRSESVTVCPTVNTGEKERARVWM